MKRAVAIIIAVSVLGIAVLGFLSMAHENSHNPGSCIGFVTGADCPAVLVSFSDIAGHIAAVQGFSLGIISSSLLLMGVLLVVALWFLRQKILNIQPSPAVVHALAGTARPYASSLIRLKRWLARHEARDPHASSWVHESFGHS